MKYANNVSAMVYTALSGNIGATVYDFVPALPAGQPNANFPYVVLRTYARPWDTDDLTGEQHTVNIDVWSRYKGKKQTQTVLAAIWDILHRASLSGSGIRVVDSLHEFSEVFPDEDGKTMHGVSRYLITVEGA